MSKQGPLRYEINGTLIGVLPNAYVGKPTVFREHGQNWIGEFRVFADAGKLAAVDAALAVQTLTAAGTFAPGADLAAKIAAAEDAQKVLAAAAEARDAAIAATLKAGTELAAEARKPLASQDKKLLAKLLAANGVAAKAEVAPLAAHVEAGYALTAMSAAASAAAEADLRRAVDEAAAAVEAAQKAVVVLPRIEVRAPWVEGQDPYTALYAQLGKLPQLVGMRDVP